MSSQNEFIAKLNQLGCVTFSGPQATEYLQGQVTVDVEKLHENVARIGAHCDFKGKTWSVFTALRSNDFYYLIMRKSALEKSLAEFKKYGVFSKVDIQQSVPELSFFGISGNAIVSTLKSLFADLNEQHLSVLSNEFGSAICLNISTPRYILALNADGLALFSKLTNVATYQDESHWEAMDIVDGIPYIESQTSNEFVPQMLNLQSVGGIDFDKGCYMGQETIARTKFLGRNKKASYILIHQGIDASRELKPGDALEKQAGENWRSGGKVLQSAVLNDATLLFGVLANDTQTGDVLRLKAFPEKQFTVSPLPYKLD